MWMQSNTVERRDARWHAVGSAKFHLPRASVSRDSPLPNCGLDHIAQRQVRGGFLLPPIISTTGMIRLTSPFSRADRFEEDQTGRYPKTKKKASK
jgi:hypothetical protein